LLKIKDTRTYVKTKKETHKYKGWHWNYKAKKFYRWSDLPNA